MTSNINRFAIGTLSVLGLVLIFLFQRQNVAAWIGLSGTPSLEFFINRTLRFFLNDIFALGLVFALFPFRKYIVFAVFVQLVGVVFFLLPYFVLKYYHPTYNGPWLNFLHRLILNPILVLLLIPAFYYQRQKEINK